MLNKFRVNSRVGKVLKSFPMWCFGLESIRIGRDYETFMRIRRPYWIPRKKRY